jgi:transcriptional regulator with XRE-family HTH domain
LLAAMRDKSRRHHLAFVVTKRGLAEQIREMRLARGWTQSELARATDKVQETISQLENPNYGNYTIKTLQRLAEAFDVKLTVRFDPFSELVRWMTELSTEDLAVPDYDHDPGLIPTPSRVETAGTEDAFRPNPGTVTVQAATRVHTGVVVIGQAGMRVQGWQTPKEPRPSDSTASRWTSYADAEAAD